MCINKLGKMKLVIDEKDLRGIYLPRWYGIAYEDPLYGRLVLCIIPLNLLVRYARKLYWLLYKWFKYAGYRDKFGELYLTGYLRGLLEGREIEQEIGGWQIRQIIKEEMDNVSNRVTK